LNLLGEGVTWSSRVSKILEANCGGCHNSVNPDADLDLLSESAYERLLEPSTQKPELNLVVPGDYENSYLWHKIAGDPDIVGLPMPYNPLTGEGSLTQAELGDIQTWIANGAQKDQ
jgi:ribosomal protein S16